MSDMSEDAALKGAALPDECCAKCHFARVNKSDVRNYLCHFDPPRMFMIPQPRGLAFAAEFPGVKAESWCGKFKVRSALKV
jgi:hypothetical protein